MTCPCRLTVTISNKRHHPILYLSPMHIAERVIKGFQITDPELTVRQRGKEVRRKHERGEEEIVKVHL